MAKHIQMPPTYPIPNKWTWVELRKLTKIISGYPFDSKLFSDLGTEGRPLIRIRDVVRGYTETYTTEDCPEQYFIHKNDILIGMDGDFNVGRWQDETALLNQRVCYIQSISDLLLNDYLFYFLPTPLKQINDVTPSVTVKHLSTKTIESIMIPLPPVEEQIRMCELIQSLFVKLDEAKEKAQEVVDGFETRKAAILHKAFSGELTAKWRNETGISISDWKHHRFSDLCKIVRGGSPRPAGSSEFYGGDIPFMKVADITRITTPYVESTEHFIKPAGLKKTRMVKANTLLLTNSGATLGVPAICTFDTTFNDGIAAFLDLEPKSLLFYYYFWTMKTTELRTINKGAAQPNLNTDIIGAVELDVPSLDEQLVIAEMLEKFISKEQQAKETAEAVIEQIDTMKKAILSRAFRGELGTNDSSEESAVELLKKII